MEKKIKKASGRDRDWLSIMTPWAWFTVTTVGFAFGLTIAFLSK